LAFFCGWAVIKRMRGGTRAGFPAVTVSGGKRPALDDGQRLLVEQWKRSIVNEKVAAKQRRIPQAASPVHPSSLEEIKAVTRIGPLRLLRRHGRSK
jgi:hypothetical protein